MNLNRVTAVKQLYLRDLQQCGCIWYFATATGLKQGTDGFN
jgi:hypothetical protein